MSDHNISIFLPVLIRNKRDKAMTEACVTLLRNQTEIPFELVIVETESRECERLADIYLHQPVNPGVVPTHNIGFKMCKGDYIATMSNDIYVTSGWLEALMKCFELDDCGAATLAACELGHKKGDYITEGLYFPCSIWCKEFARYDENFLDTWADADMATAMYVHGGKKMYRNYNAVAHHLWNQTIRQDETYLKNWKRNFDYYRQKYEDYKNTRIYQVFTEGIIV